MHVIAAVYMERDEPEEAVRVAREGEVLARNAADRERARMKLLAANANRELLWKEALREVPGDDRRLKSLYEGALRKAELAVKVSRTAEDKPLLAASLHTLGYVYFFGGRDEDVRKVADESRTLFEELGDMPGAVRTLALIAQVHLRAGDHGSAKTVLEEAAAMARKAKDEDGQEFIAELQQRLSSRPPPRQEAFVPAAPDVQAVVPLAASSAAQEVTFQGPDPHLVRQHMIALVLNMTGGGEDVDGDTPLMESGIDSLASVELRTQLQSEFKINLPSTVMFNYPTISAMTELLVNECTAKKISWGK